MSIRVENDELLFDYSVTGKIWLRQLRFGGEPGREIEGKYAYGEKNIKIAELITAAQETPGLYQVLRDGKDIGEALVGEKPVVGWQVVPYDAYDNTGVYLHQLSFNENQVISGKDFSFEYDGRKLQFADREQKSRFEFLSYYGKENLKLSLSEELGRFISVE